MAKNLAPLTISAPGFLGLNTQQAGSILPPGWATKLDNVIYDDVGRIASRKGSQQLNTTVIPNTPTISSVHEYVDASGVRVNILAGDNKIFKEVAGVITDVSGTITTPTGDDWQFANFNGWCVGFQNGHVPIVATSATAPSFVDSGGTQYNGDMVLSAYGRIWTVFGNDLKYSDLLINDFTGGSSGAFDLAKFWPNGMDEAVAIVDFNGLLIVFGKESTLIYENADDVNNMALVEGLDGIGCIARDSVQVIGKDIIFLSSSGLRSFGRSIKEESMPLTDISQHIRDSILSLALNETAVEITSVYNSDDGFYLISFPTQGISYMFDLKFPNQDGTWKAATWDIGPTALMYSEDHVMHMAASNGYLSTYTGYRDEDASSGSGGASYQMLFDGVWNDFGEEVAPFLKIPKNVSVLASGTPASSITFKWAVDYSTVFHERSLAFNTNPPSAYGIAQYGIDTYSATGDFERIRSTLSHSGQVIKVGIETTISGNALALQRLDVLAKVGRLAL